MNPAALFPRPRVSTIHSTLLALACFLILGSSLRAQSIHHPDEVATIIIHGFSSSGSQASGTVGLDESDDLATELAEFLNRPTGQANPLDPAQITITDYYGDTYPNYYTQADRDEGISLAQRETEVVKGELSQTNVQLRLAMSERARGVPRSAGVTARF